MRLVLLLLAIGDLDQRLGHPAVRFKNAAKPVGVVGADDSQAVGYLLSVSGRQFSGGRID
jgi:hypothetical protein